MSLYIGNLLLIIFIGIHMKMIYVHGNINQICQLENRTFIFNICKIRPSLTIPVCAGYCSSITQWNFNLNQFVRRTNACTVIEHRTEYFVCPDSTHTAIELMIPLKCSCIKSSCNRYKSL
ncbi:unnamed protein product [Rotaria sp. Silwood1]|nr:unnamed protein product [Rotaria sp. Silwood1]CAF4989888.1 unnamed protein product [Rotaria sp. Silwood1]